MTDLEKVARAIYAKRPDCQGRPWPGKTHFPIAAVDLSFIYAKAALEALDLVPVAQPDRAMVS